MKELLGNVAKVVKSALDAQGLGEFTVGARTTRAYSNEGNENINLTLLVQNDAAETDPAKYKKAIDEALKNLAPLKPYIDFTLPEPEKDHLKKLGEKFNSIRAKATALGLNIPEAFGDWFKEQAKIAELKEKSSDNIYLGDDRYAVTITRDDTSVKASFKTPLGVNTEDAQKEVQARIEAIKTLLGRMTAKKLTQDPAEQVKIIAEVRALDVVVKAENKKWGNEVTIEFRSPKVTEAMKAPGGLEALKEDQIKTLKETNPLMKLKDGDGLTPENPAQLQKAIARAILFEGEKGEKPVAMFAKIAGPMDVKTAMEKTLKFIKANKPEMVPEVDALIKDELFEKHAWGQTKSEDGTPVKQKIDIHKHENEHNYIPGQFRVDLSIPAEKLPEVIAQLGGQAPTRQASSPDITSPSGEQIDLKNIDPQAAERVLKQYAATLPMPGLFADRAKEQKEATPATRGI